MNIDEYIINWSKTEGIKPSNEDVFIDLFIEWVNSIDDSNDIQFDGDGAYFGKQIRLEKDRNYNYGRSTAFEIAYDFNNHISVYTAYNEGYWNPEYISITADHPRFGRVRLVLIECMKKLFALP